MQLVSQGSAVLRFADVGRMVECLSSRLAHACPVRARSSVYGEECFCLISNVKDDLPGGCRRSVSLRGDQFIRDFMKCVLALALDCPFTALAGDELE